MFSASFGLEADDRLRKTGWDWLVTRRERDAVQGA